MGSPMPLNRVAGEHVEGLGDDFTIVPLAKWAATIFWEGAYMNAVDKFTRAGAQGRIAFDDQHVLVQEYLDQGCIVFIFCQIVVVNNWKKQSFGMKELYHPSVVKLSPAQKAELVMAGRWATERVVH